LAEEGTAIRAWLAHIEETDPATIADVLAWCRSDAQARASCLEQARQIPPPPEPDYTATCGACRHFQRIDHPNNLGGTAPKASLKPLPGFGTLTGGGV